MLASKYLLDTDAYFERHPEITGEAKELVKKEIEAEDFDMFSFVVTYVFM
ncbi:MAG: hypothetical protein FWE32_04530 [Oscillospiraceae bacterium]|nr:hypothetical protein [Oscillospiraceae bacterium]